MGGRSTIEIMALLLTGTVCFLVLTSGVAIMVVEIFHPESDTDTAVNALSDTLSLILGALLGLLAGRSDTTSGRQELHKRPDGVQDDM